MSRGFWTATRRTGSSEPPLGSQSSTTTTMRRRTSCFAKWNIAKWRPDAGSVSKRTDLHAAPGALNPEPWKSSTQHPDRGEGPTRPSPHCGGSALPASAGRRCTCATATDMRENICQKSRRTCSLSLFHPPADALPLLEGRPISLWLRAIFSYYMAGCMRVVCENKVQVCCHRCSKKCWAVRKAVGSSTSSASSTSAAKQRQGQSEGSASARAAASCRPISPRLLPHRCDKRYGS